MVGIYSVSRTQSIAESLALSWRVSSDVSKGEERAGTKRGEERREEERTVLVGSGGRAEGRDDIQGVQIEHRVKI